ncbi:MAG: cell division protein ZapD [Chromatiales bacterium]|nr:cell division protein ZapD [Chromatiales bacterium]
MSERPPSPMIVYEQPLSERIRAFMRLEFLFARARHLLEQDDAWASRGVVETINDVMAVLGRSDLKKELVKELERQAGTLENLARNPQVDEARLGAVLARVRDSWSRLRTSESALGQELRDIELLSAVRQRSSIPAGSCGFDLPAYHQWLRRPVAERQQDLLDWLAVFDDLGESIELCLSLIRQSAVATHEVAGAGFFQRNLETTPPCQMLRVAIPPESAWYPEISAGKHRFTIRFMIPGRGANRATQTDEDVAFDLLCCMI